MMFVFYWMTLAFGGLVTVLGCAFLVLAAFRRRNRRVLLSLGLTSLFAAWVPTALFFVLLYAAGARPAGG